MALAQCTILQIVSNNAPGPGTEQKRRHHMSVVLLLQSLRRTHARTHARTQGAAAEILQGHSGRSGWTSAAEGVLHLAPVLRAQSGVSGSRRRPRTQTELRLQAHCRPPAAVAGGAPRAADEDV
uniref:Uncharacterized protein n=1 Tax=Knipowitschia caucasica TaxID=637954 RepID=A0AAV2MD71_KNICA